MPRMRLHPARRIVALKQTPRVAPSGSHLAARQVAELQRRLLAQRVARRLPVSELDSSERGRCHAPSVIRVRHIRSGPEPMGQHSSGEQWGRIQSLGRPVDRTWRRRMTVPRWGRDCRRDDAGRSYMPPRGRWWTSPRTIMISCRDHAAWQLSHTALIQPDAASLRRRQRAGAPQNSQTEADRTSAAMTSACTCERAASDTPVILIRTPPSFSFRSPTSYLGCIAWSCS